MNTNPMRLSGQQREQFERDGYLFPIKALDEREARDYLRNYMDYVTRNKARLEALPGKEKYRVLSETHFVLPWACELVMNGRILDTVESLLGPNLLAWGTTWFSKMPGEKTYVSWHQDGTYWNLRTPGVVTAWVALSPCSAANGCMRVIPGTHMTPLMPQRETYAPDNALSRGQEIAVEVDEAQAVDLTLQPGEMSLHHIWIIHGSNANNSNIPRIGIAIRYTTPETVQEGPQKPLAMLVRGEDQCGNFELIPPPTKDYGPETEAVHAALVNRLRASVLQDAGKKE